MTPLLRTLPCIKIGRMIKQAEQGGISSSLFEKLLKLYLGTDTQGFLNDWGVYMQCNFNQLALTLKVRTPSELITAIRRCGWFILGKVTANTPSNYSLLWFASPIFLNETELKKHMSAEDAPQNPVKELDIHTMRGDLFSTADLHCKNAAVNCIINYTGVNNIILSGGRTQASQGSETEPKNSSESLITNQRQKVYLPREVKEQQVQAFIYAILRDKDFFCPLFHFLTDTHRDGEPRKPEEVFTVEQARDILRQLIYHHIKPYFMEREKFFEKNMTFEGRKANIRKNGTDRIS